MGLSPATISEFVKWRVRTITNLNADRDWNPPSDQTLASVLWLSNIRKNRKQCRAPPGVTVEAIAEKFMSHPGWGGKRVAGLSVAKMIDMETQGRSHEMVASRNGRTGKQGVRPPRGDNRKRKREDREKEVWPPEELTGTWDSIVRNWWTEPYGSTASPNAPFSRSLANTPYGAQAQPLSAGAGVPTPQQNTPVLPPHAPQNFRENER
jgi:hypothetical protein